MSKEITTQIGRIRTILKPPGNASPNIMKRVTANLRELERELPKHRNRVKFTNKDNIGKSISTAPFGIPEYFGMVASLVGDLIECKILWKDLLDAKSTIVQRSLVVVGDKYDVALATHLLGYLLVSLQYIHVYAAQEMGKKNQKIRSWRRAGLANYDKTIDAREFASNARQTAANSICVYLKELLDTKGTNRKEEIILKYIFNNLKPDFADSPGPKTPRHYSDKVDWAKARTNPTKFQNNKLIN